MRYVIVPKDITIVVDDNPNKPVITVDENGDKQPLVFSFKKWLDGYVLNSPTMVRGGGSALRRVIKMMALFDDVEPADVIGVEDDDYRLARTAIDDIQWPPGMVRWAYQLLPFIEAWEQAKDQDEAWKKKYDAEQAKKPSLRAVEDDAPKAG